MLQLEEKRSLMQAVNKRVWTFQCNCSERSRENTEYEYHQYEQSDREIKRIKIYKQTLQITNVFYYDRWQMFGLSSILQKDY